jgi:hypothetical protein
MKIKVSKEARTEAAAYGIDLGRFTTEGKKELDSVKADAVIDRQEVDRFIRSGTFHRDGLLSDSERAQIGDRMKDAWDPKVKGGAERALRKKGLEPLKLSLEERRKLDADRNGKITKKEVEEPEKRDPARFGQLQTVVSGLRYVAATDRPVDLVHPDRPLGVAERLALGQVREKLAAAGVPGIELQHLRVGNGRFELELNKGFDLDHDDKTLRFSKKIAGRLDDSGIVGLEGVRLIKGVTLIDPKIREIHPLDGGVYVKTGPLAHTLSRALGRGPGGQDATLFVPI